MVISEAFEYYYSLGDKRSLDQVARHVLKTPCTVSNWSSSFNWQKRVQQRDIDVAQQLQVRNIKEIANTKANYRKVLQALVKKFIDNLQADKVEMNKVGDLERVLKLDMLLMGEVSEITQVNQQHGLNASDKSLIEKVCKSLEHMYAGVEEGDIIEPKVHTEEEVQAAEVFEDLEDGVGV